MLSRTHTDKNRLYFMQSESLQTYIIYIIMYMMDANEACQHLFRSSRFGSHRE